MLCSDFCLHKNQSHAPSFLLFAKSHANVGYSVVNVLVTPLDLLPTFLRVRLRLNVYKQFSFQLINHPLWLVYGWFLLLQTKGTRTLRGHSSKQASFAPRQSKVRFCSVFLFGKHPPASLLFLSEKGHGKSLGSLTSALAVALLPTNLFRVARLWRFLQKISRPLRCFSSPQKSSFVSAMPPLNAGITPPRHYHFFVVVRLCRFLFQVSGAKHIVPFGEIYPLRDL